MKQTMGQILASGRQMFAPCVYDAWSARAMEAAGFDAVLISGGAMSIVLGCNREDDMTANEMIDITHAVSRAVNIPVIVDAADGHAEKPTGVYRNMKRLAQAGAAAFTIDDGAGDFVWDHVNLIPFQGPGGVRGPKDLNQLMEPFSHPKSLTHILGRGFRPALPRYDYLKKVDAAVKACEGTDCLVIARVECYDTYGFDEVVERINAARELGASLWTVCLGMWSEEEGRMFSQALGGPAMWPDVVSLEDRTPNVTLEALSNMGFQLVTCHIAEKGAMYGMDKFGARILQSHSTQSIDEAETDWLSTDKVEELLWHHNR